MEEREGDRVQSTQGEFGLGLKVLLQAGRFNEILAEDIVMFEKEGGNN